MSRELVSLIDFIARSLVDKPDQVEVRETRGESDAAIIELRVAPDDLGKVIGKAGATARAMRSVLFAASGRARQRAVLNIVED